MKKYGVNELRKMFLEFFESKGHLKMNSFSLIPHNDNSLLLINSGMAPLKPYFTGQEIPPRRRVTTCQKCIRTGDIENVGKTARHGTFFEMLGNFSFGDYFKHEAINWTWEFLTEVVGLDKDRLYPSVYEEDDEAFEIWNKEIGIAPERIFKFGKADNFWEHGAGPCGPCSEVYYDRGIKYGCGKPDCKVGCDCDRYMEVWNNVFTQFDNDGNNHYTELEHKNIDTGMGLERLAVVVQDVDSIFDVDTLKAHRDKICDMAGVTYKQDEKTDVSIRLITDHIRSVTFMTSDGILPSNLGRGYVLRRLLRRAARHGRLLGIKGCFLAELSKTVIEVSKDAYPELLEKQEHIFATLNVEEENFNKTIDQGLAILNTYIEEIKEAGEIKLDGERAFKLYDTYGFPLDLTTEILEEAGIAVDEAGFAACMKEQKERARKARKVTNYMGADATVYEQIPAALQTEFVGYDSITNTSKILTMTTEDEIVSSLEEGENGSVLVAATPFYATMGGQCGDIGTIKTSTGEFIVKETVKVVGGKIAHIGYVTNGTICTGDDVSLTVDSEKRAHTCMNHSATHLLQKALKLVLGGHVEQAGSYVSSDRLRFDFTHNAAVTKEELERVEAIVNEEIDADLNVQTDVMSLEAAKETGAMALFGEKYGDTVRVVSMGDFSKELCGGTHVPHTGVIRTFKIISEQGVAAGVRRIEALTSNGAFAYYKQQEDTLKQASILAKTEPSKLAEKIEAMYAEIKTLQSENQKLKDKMAKDSVKDVLASAVVLGDYKILPVKMQDVDMNALRNLGDDLKAKIGSGVVILASQADGKVNLIVTATEDAVASGAHAGNIIKQIAPLVGGGGGGRPNMAQAGGKNPSGIENALQMGVEEAKKQLA
ncbi:MAG: alanine--tRNA ligase [Lachnospiraceae bacterium]|nr:alanine--tRNA ligase [Lachnospiraceae bacterium]